MPGMRFVPDNVHRERDGSLRPATWYIIWLGPPHAEGSIILGRSKRLRRHLWHRFFPEAGGACRDIKGWVAGVEWLLEEHRGQAGKVPGRGTEAAAS
jgi:hypothetical protein